MQAPIGHDAHNDGRNQHGERQGTDGGTVRIRHRNKARGCANRHARDQAGPRRREDGGCHAVERHLIARRRGSKAEAVNGHRCVHARAAWCNDKEPDTRTSRREPLNGEEITDLIAGVDRNLSLPIDHSGQPTQLIVEILRGVGRQYGRSHEREAKQYESQKPAHKKARNRQHGHM